MERRTFVRLVSAGGACLGVAGTTACGQGCSGQDSGRQCRHGVTMRPYQLLCAICEIGREGVRPHILVCAVCQYGTGSRPPYETDNLPEMLQFIMKNPKARIKMADHADWMMCAPCPSMQKHAMYDFPICVNGSGCAGLTSQLRDVRVLRTLGLQYGNVVNARELYRKILERITSTVPICGTISQGVRKPSVWWSECGHHSVSLPEYVKGRQELITTFGFSEMENKG